MRDDYTANDYTAKMKLLELLDEARHAIDATEELFQDYLEEGVKPRNEISLRLYSLGQLIQDSLPLKCRCGNFKFREVRRTIVKAKKPASPRFPREHLKTVEIVYFCDQCGTIA